jgi:hypothetical protein
MRQLASLVLSFIILFSSLSAHALSYTISASQSWAFSGIPVDVEFEAGGISKGLVCGESGGASCVSTPLPGGSVPGQGSADGDLTISDVNVSMFATSTLIAPGLAIAPRSGADFSVTALAPGWLNVTLNYQLQEIGTVPAGGILQASALMTAGHSSEFPFSFGIDQNQRLQTTKLADQSLNIARTITGSLTISKFFDTIGQQSGFVGIVESRVEAVPGPDTFWLLLGGLATLVAMNSSSLQKEKLKPL